MPSRLTDLMQDLPPVTPVDYGAMPPRRRPKIVGFIGWICAGLGYVSFFMKGSQLPSYFFPEMLKKWVNPDWNPPQLSRGQFTIAVFFLFAEMFVALVCMSGGLGTLKMREWGRKLLLAYAVAAIVLTLLKSIWQIQMFDFMLDYQLSTTTQPVDRQLAGNRQFVALIMSGIAQSLWPLIILSILTRRYVKDAFDAVRLGSGASEGWQSESR